MILVRDIFHLKFGKAKEAKELIKAGRQIVSTEGKGFGKVMMDLTGRSYTLVIESEFDNLSEFEGILKQVFSKEEWQKWYQKIIPLVENSEREIYTLIE